MATRKYNRRRVPGQKEKDPPTISVIVPIVIALIGLAGVAITAFRTSEIGEMKGRQTAVAESQPTIEALGTQVAAGEIKGKQTAEVELQPTVAVLGTQAAAGEIKGRQTAEAELQPTVAVLGTQAAAGEIKGRQTAEAELRLTIDALRTQVAAATTPTSPVTTGQLEGLLTDRAGNPISDISVSIRNGPETVTDMAGGFVLSNVPAGNQLIVVKPPSGEGQLTQNISIEANQTTKTSVIYNSATSRLGLLSITAPVDGGVLEVRPDGTVHRATIYGRSDGLAQVFGEFDVWVLISSERDESFWVQRPPALVDPNSNTWRANVLLGSEEHPPSDGDFWDIVAVAADADSDINRIISTPKLSELPPHIRSNVVTAVTQIKR